MPVKNRGKRKIMSEMNLTPLIDVMLVLLVIFMITAPLLTIGVKVDLPKVAASSINDNDTSIVVFIDKAGQVFVGDVLTSPNSLADKLQAIIGTNSKDPKIFIKGDKSINYGTIMEVMGAINRAGFKKVVLVTDMPNKSN